MSYQFNRIHRMPLSRNPLIYVVDDDPDEHYLLQSVFTNKYASCNLRCFSHGRELLTQLTHQLDGHLPDLILLDLDMPVLNGHEVLQVLKNDSDWQGIPVIVRTSSVKLADINRSYELGSRAFIVKNSSYRQLAEWVSDLSNNWLN